MGWMLGIESFPLFIKSIDMLPEGGAGPVYKSRKTGSRGFLDEA